MGTTEDGEDLQLSLLYEWSVAMEAEARKVIIDKMAASCSLVSGQ